MKHVFLANSNLHGRNCIAVAEILKPDPDDIIFLHRRKLKLNHGHKQICLMDDLGWKFLPYSSFPKLVIYLIYLSIILRPKFNAKLNAYLDKDKFIIYVPHIFSADIRLLINHENCCGMCVVDEGTNGFFQKSGESALLTSIEKTKRFKFLAALLGILHIVNRDSVMPNQKSIDKVFTHHPNTFLFYPRKKIKIIPIELIFPEAKTSLVSKSYHQVFLIDPFCHENRVDEKTYKLALERVLEIIKPIYDIRKLEISFHPTVRHDEDYKNRIINVFERHFITPVILDDDLEQHFLNNHGILFCTYSSSMIWANIWGWQVVTWIDFLPRALSEKVNQVQCIGAYYKACNAQRLKGAK